MSRKKTIILVLATLLAVSLHAADFGADSLLYRGQGHGIAPVDTVPPPVYEDDPFVLSDEEPVEMFLPDVEEPVVQAPAKNWGTWRPNAKRAMWLAIVLPGAGQIYNRKYWKLPIIYGGFVGCIYAMRWNNMMYRDYSQAYMDIMDQNPETQSYNQFLHLGRTIDDSNRSAYENKFKRRKDYYRRYRDLSAFILIGVYAISVIDAYVDASLSEFDISDDLSLKVSPAIMNGAQQGRNPLSSAAVGLQCSLNF